MPFNRIILAHRAPIITLSGGTITGLVPTSAGIRLNADGTVDQDVDGAFSQISADTDWIRPLIFAPGIYQAFCVNDGPGGLNPGSDNENEWIDIADEPYWFTTSTSTTCNLRISIRLGSVILVNEADYELVLP